MRTTVTQTMNRLLFALAIGAAALLGGCAATKSPSNSVYDFGAPGAAGTPPQAPLAALVVADVTGSPALDNERMFYRLEYADPLQARTYARSRWSSTPLEMLTQRLKSRIAQSGVKVLSVVDAAGGVPMLRVEVDDFSHSFESVSASHGTLTVRASLFDGHRLIDQRSFSRKSAAPSADAGGGARALATASDAVAADIIGWLATVGRAKQ